MNNPLVGALGLLRFCFLPFFCFFLYSSAYGEHRIALVIGNQSYKAGPLRNPINDARAMSEMLKSKLGFEVIELHDVGLGEMTQQLRQFVNKVKDGGVALVYFAGHGAQYEEKNYLFPINFEANFAEDLPYSALPLQKIQDKLNRKNKNGTNLILLDSCRNNPLARKDRSYMRGLAEVKLHPNSYIAYATSPNDVASDNPQASNGLFTQYLLKYMPVEGTNLDTMIRHVRNDVYKVSGGRQVPYGVNLLREEFCFNGCSTSRSRKTELNQLLQTFAQLKPLAKQGNTNAQLKLGNLYSDKNKSIYNINEAIFWYSKAAEQGNEYAQHNLGIIYYSQTNYKFPGVKSNDKLAFYWILQAAKKNIPASQGIVSGMYENGRGVYQSQEESLKWLKQAAANGNTSSQAMLGLYYEEGLFGLTKNYKKALGWYQLSAEKKHIQAQFYLAELLRKGGYGIDSDYRLSNYWLERAAFNRHERAEVLLGFYYCEGLGVPKNLKTCATWISMGFENPKISQQDRVFANNVWQKYGLDKYHTNLNTSKLN